MAIFLRQPALGRAAYKRLVELNKDNERYLLGLMACDEDENIRRIFALPCCSLNGAVGRADSSDYLRNLLVAVDVMTLLFHFASLSLIFCFRKHIMSAVVLLMHPVFFVFAACMLVATQTASKRWKDIS